MKKNKFILFINRYWYIFLILLLIIIKHIITINLPINIRDASGADEYLMLTNSENLIKGNYLGSYNWLTLVKGIGFPIFVMLGFKIGLSNLCMYSLFYSFSSLIALYAFSKFTNNRKIKILFFAGILYCPAAFENGQLLYRNMITIPLSILLVSSFFMIYYNLINKKNNVVWLFICSISWAWLWNTREDTIWTIPLAFTVFLICTLIIVFNKSLTDNLRQKFKKIIIIFIPFYFLIFSINLISFINYKYYGIYTTNQLNDSNYTKAVLLMMRVKPPEFKENVTITRDTLKLLYKYSPTLNLLSNRIEYDYEKGVGLVNVYENNGEINEDLITWELTGTAASLGFYETSQKAEEFWGNVYKELKKAIDDGKLETRFMLPSRSLIPYPNKKGSFKKLIFSIGSLFKDASQYNYNTVYLYKSSLPENVIRRYETITGNYAIRSDKTRINIDGWIFSKTSNKSLKLLVVNENNQIVSQLNFTDSIDIYDGYSNIYNSSKDILKKCRINSIIYVDQDKQSEIYYLKGYLNNELVFNMNLNDKNIILSNKNIIYGFNNEITSVSIEVDPMYSRALRHVNIANNIRRIYQVTGFQFLLISLIYYFILTCVVIKQIIDKKYNFINKWLFLSATLLSSLVIIIGLGYTNAFSFPTTYYLSSCNGILNLFICSSICFLLIDIINYCFDKKNRKSA